MYLVIVVLSLLALELQPANTSSEYGTCSKMATTQTALHRCADQEAARADEELRVVYQRLLREAREQAGAVETIEEMRLAWEKYRDAYLKAMYPRADKQAFYGTLSSVEVLLQRAALTRVHARSVAALGERLATPSR